MHTCCALASSWIFLLLCFQAFDLPETESHGGLLGYDRQDLYLSVGLQTDHGRENEKSTRVHEGRDGTVRWDDETISIKYSNAGDAVTAEVGSPRIFSKRSGTFCGLKVQLMPLTVRVVQWVSHLEGLPAFNVPSGHVRVQQQPVIRLS